MMTEETVQYQVSVFGTPVPMRTMTNSNTPLEPPVRTYQHNQQCQYEILFPPGAMGLELEPVITSSERTIGCRVKDFYFGIAHDGIDQAYLQEHVMIGDIIAKVNDVSVVSLPFNNILEMLRSMTSTTRKIVFKNITASWEASYKGSHNQVSPTTAGAKIPKQTPSKSKAGSSKGQTNVAKQVDAENTTNGVSHPTTEKSSQLANEPAALAQIRAQQLLAKARGAEETQQRKLSALSPKKQPGGIDVNNSARSSKSGSSKSSGDNKSGVFTSAIPIYDDSKDAKSPQPNRSIQKLLDDRTHSKQQFDTMSIADSSVNSPFKLRKPQELESLNNTFTFSVQDVDASTVNSMSSARHIRSSSAPSGSPSPRSKQLHSLSSSGKHAAALLLNRTSSSAVPPLRDGCSSPLTPSSILRLKQQQRASGSLSPVVSRTHTPPRAHTARTPSGRSHAGAVPTVQADLAEPLENLRMSESSSVAPSEEALPQMQLPVQSLVHPGHNDAQSAFSHIIDRVRGTIGTGLVQVGNVLGARAEKALVDTSHLLPLYSTTEMNQVMTKKYDLLSELSHSCMLLGLAEEKEKTYGEQLVKMRSLEDQVLDLQTALEEAQQARESLQFKCKAAETEVSVLKVEKAEDKELLASYKAEIARQNEKLAAHAAQISTAEERIASAAAENNHLRSEWRDREGLWQSQILTFQEENRVFREQAESYTATLQAAQTERDRSVAELEVIQEMAAADKQAAMSEFARLREAMASQQYLYKEQLIKHDAAMHQLKLDLSEAQAGLEAITELHKASEHAKAQLETKVASTSAEVLQLTAKYTMCQQDLRASEEAKEYNRKLAVQAQSQLKEQQMQLVISSSEHGMLSDQARLAALTVEALHSEINMLRRDIEVQRDELNQKDLEIKTATSKFQEANDEIETLLGEAESTRTCHAEEVSDLREELGDLRKTLEALRQDRAQEATERAQLVVARDAGAQRAAQLQEQLTLTGARATELSTRLEDATIMIQNLEQEKQDLIAAQQVAIAELSAEMTGLREQLLDEMLAVRTDKESETTTLSETIASLQRKIAESEAQFNAALQLRDSELSSVRSKASCVEGTLSQVRQEMTRLSLEHRQQLAHKDEEIVALAEKCQQSDANSREQAVAHERAMAAAVQSFEQREKEFLSALSLAEDTQDSLRSDLHQQLSQTSKQCTEQSLLIKDLQVKLQESTVVIGGKAEELVLRVEEIELLRSDVRDRDAQIALLESKATVAGDAAKQSAAQIAKIKDDVAALKLQLQAKAAEADKSAALVAFQQTSFALKEEKLTQDMQALQAQVEKSADRLAASNSARRTERAQLFAALQGVQMELAELRSHLKETKVDITGLGGVHTSIVRSLWSQNQEAKAELAALLGKQPGTLKLEGRLTQLLQEKEAASRRAAVAEQNTIESESRCVNALTKAMAAEKHHAEAKAMIVQLRESLAALEMTVAQGSAENAALTEAKDALTRKLQATSDECAILQRQVHDTAQEIEQLQALLRETRTREERALKIASEEAASLKDKIETLQREKQEWERTASSSQAEQLATATRFQIQCSALQEHLEVATQRAAADEKRWAAQCTALQVQLDAAAQRAVSDERRWSDECEALQQQIQTTLACTALERARLEDEGAALQAQLQQIEEASQREKLHWQKQHTDLQERYVLSQQQSAAEKEQLAAEAEAKLLTQAQEFNTHFEEVVREHAAKIEALQAAQREALEKEKDAHSASGRSLQDHYKLLIDELAAERDQVCEALESAHVEIQQLQSALQETDGERAKFEQQVTLYSASQSATQHQAVALQSQVDGLQQEVQVLKAANEAGAAKALKEVSLLEKALCEERLQVALMEAKLSGMEESLTENKAAYEALRDKLKQVQSSEDTKGTSLQAAESLVTSLQAQLAEIKASHAALRSEHSSCRAQLEEINTDLLSKLEVISTLNAALKDEETKASQHHGNVGMILKDLEISQERKKELKQQLAHAQLAQRAAEKQSNIFKAQVQELRDTLTTQQNVIAEAETRELEYHANRRKLEHLLSEGETRFTKLQNEYKQLLERGVQTRGSATDSTSALLQAELRKVTAHANNTQKALDEKCAELQSLHKHVTELLTSTFSPRKETHRDHSEIERSNAVVAQNVQQGDVGKENVLTEVLVEQLQKASAHAFEITESANSDSQWHNRLVECSLGIYELLVAAFQQLQLQQAAALTHSATAAAESIDKFNRLCVCLSHSQHQLHELLMRAPWMRLPESAQALPTLTAAHEHFRHLIAPPAHMQMIADVCQPSQASHVKEVHVGAVVQRVAAPKPAEPTKTSAVITHKAAAEKPAVCPSSPPTVMHSVNLNVHGSPRAAERAEEDDHVRTSNDSGTLEDLLASLMCNQSGVSSNNSSVCSAVRSHHRAAGATHRSAGHSGSSSLRNSAEEAILAAKAVSAEIDEVSFEVFTDVSVGATPPSIKRIMGAMEGPRSSGSKGSRPNDHDTSFDSVVSDLFNLSADTGCDSDEESSVFYHYSDTK